MSGQTIREVILKISLEMGQSKVRAPDFSEVERKIRDLRGQYQAAFRGGPTGGGMGGGGGSDFDGGTAGGRGFGGPGRQLKTGEMQERHQLERMRRFLELSDRQDFVIRRSTAAWRENARAMGEAATAAGRHNGALMQLIASHEGMLRIPNGSARLLGMLPGPVGAGLMAGAAAVAIPAFDRSMRRSNARDFMGRGGNFSENSIIDNSLFGSPYTRIEANQTGKNVIRTEGLFGMIGRKSGEFSEFMTGIGDSEFHFQQEVRDARTRNRWAAARTAESKRIGGLTQGFAAGQMRDQFAMQDGLMTAEDRLRGFDQSAASTRAGILRGRNPNGDIAKDSAAADFDLQTAQQRLGILREVGAELDAERNKILENTRLAKQQVDIERDRLKAKQEAIGGADSKDIGRLRGIAGKLAGGQDLTVEEARLARQFGVANDAATATFRKRFEANFTPEQQKQLGLGQELAQAERGLADAFRDQRDALPEIEEAIAKASEETRKTLDKLVGLFEKAFDMRKLFEESISRIEQIEKNGQNQHQRGHAAGQ